MRPSFMIMLGVTLLLGGVYWYQSGTYKCPVPLRYTVADIDPSFDLTRADAEAAVIEAMSEWEAAAGRTLFVSEPAGDLRISFLFDDRQATADAQTQKEQQLNESEQIQQQMREEIAQLESQFQREEEEFLQDKAAYDALFTTYNERVRQLNDRGGATAAEFSELEEEKATLDQQATTLQETSARLNGLATEINQLGAEANRLIRQYNQAVAGYNSQFGDGEVFTQGDYVDGNINIYKFSDENELRSVLIHELGHALGIGHVNQPGSYMYYMLETGGVMDGLSRADKAALQDVCRFDSREFFIRQTVRSVLSVVS